MTPWHRDTVTPWHHDTVTPWHHDTVTPWHRDTMTPWHSDTVTPWSVIRDHVTCLESRNHALLINELSNSRSRWTNSDVLVFSGCIELQRVMEIEFHGTSNFQGDIIALLHSVLCRIDPYHHGFIVYFDDTCSRDRQSQTDCSFLKSFTKFNILLLENLLT